MKTSNDEIRFNLVFPEQIQRKTAAKLFEQLLIM
jgi:hypothetical protein